MKKAITAIIILIVVLAAATAGLVVYNMGDVTDNTNDNNEPTEEIIIDPENNTANNANSNENANTSNEISNNTSEGNNETQNTSSNETNNESNEGTTNNNNSEQGQENELFSQYYEKAEALENTMTLEEKVGQMFLARFPESGVIDEIKSQNPGGYILFGRDFDNETKSSMLQKLNECQENSKIKLALGVDEEGGTVVRVSSHKAFRSSKFKSPQQLWKQGQLPLILSDSKEKSALLKSIGLNMNLAPVSDVPSSSSDFIYARSYGRGAEKTAIYVSELIKTMNQSGMISTMKHFPGYGNNVDTHTGIAIDERSYETFQSVDFLPFKAGIEAGGPTILVSHNIVKCMDSDKPASLSENVHKILREELNFSGIIMTDDLAMDAVKTYVENGEAAVQAVLAGNDMIISSDFATQKAQVVQAVKDGRISESMINKAVKRILAWKYAYNII